MAAMSSNDGVIILGSQSRLRGSGDLPPLPKFVWKGILPIFAAAQLLVAAVGLRACPVGCLCSRTALSRSYRAERVFKLGSRGHDTQLSAERKMAAEEEAIVKQPCLRRSTGQKTRVRAWSAQSATRPTPITRLSCPTRENSVFGKPNAR